MVYPYENPPSFNQKDLQKTFAHPSPPEKALGAVEMIQSVPEWLMLFIADSDDIETDTHLQNIIQRWITGQHVNEEDTTYLKQKYEYWRQQHSH